MTPGEEASALARVLAIARRDALVQLSYQFGLLARFSEVIVTATTLFFISKLVGTAGQLAPYGGDYFAFALIGAVVLSFATLGLGTFSRTISDEQQAGSLEVLLTTPVPLAVILAGTLVVPLALTALEILVYAAIAACLGTRFSVGAIALALPALALTIAAFCALGVLSAAFIVLTKRGDPVTLVATRATAVLAGSLFPISVLPGWLQAMAKLVPAYYGLQAMRSALLTGGGLTDIAGDLVVLAAFAAVLVPVSLVCFARAVRIARISGTLGTY